MLYAPEGCRTVNIQGKDAWFEPEEGSTVELVANRDDKDYRTPFPALQTMLVELEIVPSTGRVYQDSGIPDFG